MSSIGETLRRERLRRSLDLEAISRELKISQRFLEAIEDERFDRLPASIFAKSFVRQYARLLGLDEEELAAEVQRLLEPQPPLAEAAKPHIAPLSDINVPRVEQWDAVSDRRPFSWSSSLPALALVIVVMLVCSGLYAFWQRARHPLPAQTAQAPLDTLQSPPPPIQQVQPQPPESQPPASEPAPANPASSADRSHETAPPAVPPPAPKGPVHVELTAAEPVWILARADGKYIFSGTLEPNQTRAVDANGTLVLRLGNAGGVTITLNGKPIGPVGPRGQVRDVQFTSGGFQIVAAPKPSLPLDNPV